MRSVRGYLGKESIRRGVQAFFDRFPDGKLENLKVIAAGDIGTFEWDFVTTDANGQLVRTAGCDFAGICGGQGFEEECVSKVHGLIMERTVPRFWSVRSG
jgi:hypothetical protein